MQKDLVSMRSALEFWDREKNVLRVTGEVDPIYEVSGIQAALEGSFALLFENIKGYPSVRNTGALFSRRDRIAHLFDAADYRELTIRFVNGIRNPLPPDVVDKAPCQEEVITENIDILSVLPVIKHTPKDAGRIIGGGNIFLSGSLFRNGTHLSFNRIHVQEKDWASIALNPASHMEWVSLGQRQTGGKIPITCNIGTPPAVMATSGGGLLHSIVPVGSDEAAIAGGIQGFPVDIVKAKTVDAYAIANSEWVIEGYIDTNQVVWENPEGKELGDLTAPFFPEYPGYMGRARRVFKFQATAITHRKDRPIFYTPLAHSKEGQLLGTIFREACFYELGERLRPGIVVDTCIPTGMVLYGGVIYQLRKQRQRDEGFQRNILLAALASSPGLRIAMAVDEDIDIYNADDVMWAMTTRVNPNTGVFIVDTAGGQPTYPMARDVTKRTPVRTGGIGIDATIPVGMEWRFEPGKYPVDLIDLRKWFSEAEITRAKSLQNEYDQLYAKRGY